MQKEMREVGTLLKAGHSHVLVTPERTLRLIPDNVDFDGWQDQRVLITAQRAHDDALAVSEIYPFMSERELRECTSFVLARHGSGAKEHALARLESARARDHAGGFGSRSAAALIGFWRESLGPRNTADL